MKKEVSDITSLKPRERILITAHDLFYSNGIRATGIDKIIAESSVTKVTFYRHFPSKADLIIAFLNYRHELWINWFSEALNEYGNSVEAIVAALSVWFENEQYRGCAFINALTEMAETMPEVAQIAKEHKQSMIELIKTVLPHPEHDDVKAMAIAVAIDGAIIRAQLDRESQQALMTLSHILESLK
jgi:AcrR family transcriptional regulator